ncbi:MAG: fumarylacetoacetate hydrolase family protein [Pirellulaceae bacterium]|nr:fumarylacetoacetate hydrolase family protein [Pirellulaceae bacterium]
MKLVKYRVPGGGQGVGSLDDDRLVPLDLEGRQYNSLFDILEADDPLEVADFLLDATQAVPVSRVSLLAPIDQQEVWAAGVTYLRSQKARMEESETSASCYDRVYASPRPELFFKATPHRVAGPGQPLRIRVDSQWNVPEPELALVLNSRLQLVGFTVGNDMSSRDIEGENPLYLPQAKVYDHCCGLGPCVTLATGMPQRDKIGIALRIRRGDQTAYSGSTSAAQMARTFDDLIGWLGRDNSFPTGAFLLTGTGIVPDSQFTLHPGDMIEITIDGIGTLANPVVQG